MRLAARSPRPVQGYRAGRDRLDRAGRAAEHSGGSASLRSSTSGARSRPGGSRSSRNSSSRWSTWALPFGMIPRSGLCSSGSLSRRCRRRPSAARWDPGRQIGSKDNQRRQPNRNSGRDQGHRPYAPSSQNLGSRSGSIHPQSSCQLTVPANLPVILPGAISFGAVYSQLKQAGRVSMPKPDYRCMFGTFPARVAVSRKGLCKV